MAEIFPLAYQDGRELAAVRSGLSQEMLPRFPAMDLEWVLDPD